MLRGTHLEGAALLGGAIVLTKLFLVMLQPSNVVDVDDLAAGDIQFIRSDFSG
jgi:hypothetical protein